MPAKRKAKPKCLTPGCKNPRGPSRGNCESCRQSYDLMIRNEEITDGELVAKGWRLPRQKPGKTSAATKAVENLKRKQSA